MNLQEAHELRGELEAVEAIMKRIIELWNSSNFPCADDFKELAERLDGIRANLEEIPQKMNELPDPDEFHDLEHKLGGISADMDDIIEKVEELPTADEVGA
jgi:Protein of unknown function (DUF2730)